MPNKRHLATAITALLVIGCGGVSVTRVRAAEPKHSTCEPDVYNEGAPISRPYEILCELEAETGSTLFHSKSVRTAIEKAKESACECGADAIIVHGTDTEGPGMTSGWGQSTAKVTAIGYVRQR
jgi:hypothetical protein